MLWSIWDVGSSSVVAVYRAATADEALDVFAAERGFPSFAAWEACANHGRTIQAIDVRDALMMGGRALHGPTWRGCGWYERATNDRLARAAGEPGSYEPQPGALSGFYPTAEAAAMAALTH